MSYSENNVTPENGERLSFVFHPENRITLENEERLSLLFARLQPRKVTAEKGSGSGKENRECVCVVNHDRNEKQLMGKNLLLVLNENKFGEGKLDITRSLAVIDSEGKEVKRLHEETRTMEFANAIIDETVWSTFGSELLSQRKQPTARPRNSSVSLQPFRGKESSTVIARRPSIRCLFWLFASAK